MRVNLIYSKLVFLYKKSTVHTSELKFTRDVHLWTVQRKKNSWELLSI